MKRLPLGLPLFLVAFAGLAIAQVPEAEPIDSAKTVTPIKVTIGTFNAEGLKPEIASATLTAIIDQLTAMQVIITPDPREEAVIDGGCFSDPACLKSLCEKLGVVGVLDFKLSRLGPQVRIVAKLYDAESGQVIGEKTATAQASELSESAVLGEVLTEVMNTLRLVQPDPDRQEVAIADVSPKPPDKVTDPQKTDLSTEKPGTDDGAKSMPKANETLTKVGKIENKIETRPVVMLDSDPEQTSGISARTWGWVSLGVGGALLISGTVTGGLSLSLDRDLENECGGKTCPPGHESEINRIDNLAMATNVLLGVGAAATLTGILILAIYDDDPSTGSSVEVRPTVGSGFAGAEVFGRF
jgi:hypothetical protein